MLEEECLIAGEESDVENKMNKDNKYINIFAGMFVGSAFTHFLLTYDIIPLVLSILGLIFLIWYNK
jgi:hypothetical protein